MAAAWPSGPVASETAAARLLAVLWVTSVTTGPLGAAAVVARSHFSERTSKWDSICKDPKISDATQEPANCTNYTAHACEILVPDQGLNLGPRQ